MAGSLGTISGQVRLDVSQAIAAFAAVRASAAASSGALSEAGTRVSGFGKVAAGAGLALVAGFGVAVKAAADFQKKMDYFGAVNNATAKEMEQVRQKALQLGRDSAYSAGEVADAFVEMGKAGVSVKEITGGLADAIVNMAAAADIKLDEATNIVTSQVQSFGLAMKDAKHVTDELAGAANASIVDVQDLGVSLKYVGGTAKALGISFDSTVTALSLLGKAGIKGSTAGTSLRQILVSLSGTSHAANDTLHALGIITADGANQFFDASGKAKSLAEIFQILQDHTRGLTQEQKLIDFKAIFNQRAISSVEALTSAGAKGFADMNAQIGKTTAAAVASKRMDNLAGDMKRLKSSIDTLLISAGSPLQNALRGAVQWLTKLVNWFVNLNPHTQATIVAVMGVVGAILALVGAFAMIGGTILKAMAVFRQMVAGFRLLWAMIKTVTLAIRAMSLSFLTSPIFWIAVAIIAVAAAFYLLYTRSKTFRDIIDAIGRGIKTGFMAVINWFAGLPKWFADRWKDISHWFEVGVGWVKKNWDILLAIFTGPVGVVILIWRRFGDKIVGFFKSLPGEILTFSKKALDAAIGFFQKLPYYVGYGIGYVAGLLVRGLATMATALWNWGVEGTKAVLAFFTALPGMAYNWLTSTLTTFNNWALQFRQAVINWAISAWNATVDWFSKLPGRVANYFVDMYHKSVNLFNQMVVAAKKFAVDTWNGIINWFVKLPGRVASYFSSMWSNGVSLFNRMVTSAVNFGSSLWHGIVDWVGKLPGAVSGILNNVIQAFKDLIASAWNTAASFAKGLWDGFKHGLGIHSPSYIERAMWKITDVTQTESKKLGAHVKLMRNLAGQLSEVNPAKEAAKLNTSTIAGMTGSLANQAALLQAASNSIFAGGTLTTLGGVGDWTQTRNPLTIERAARSLVTKNIEVNVFNPVAEKASDSTARKLRQLSDMGAL